MGEALVSVVIPARNAARFLEEALASALAQEGGPVEAIVVDDGSTDGTAEIAERMGVRVLRREHGGIGAARNRGVEAARGELLAFLDADDVWPEGKLAAQRRALEADAGVDMVFGQAVEFGGEGGESAPEAAMLPGTALIRMESFWRVGLFREDVKVGEFIDWMVRAREAGLRMKMLEGVCLRRRLHEENTGRTAANRLDYTMVVRAALQRRRGRSVE